MQVNANRVIGFRDRAQVRQDRRAAAMCQWGKLHHGTGVEAAGTVAAGLPDLDR
jgi:hypothetical protein